MGVVSAYFTDSPPPGAKIFTEKERIALRSCTDKERKYAR